MAKILFIENNIRADNLGVMYLSSILKNNGHEVTLLQDDLDDIKGFLRENKINFIMYSVMSGVHKWYINKNKELKKEFDFISVVGGPHFTFFPEDAENDEDIDFCVIGPGEEVILDIVNGRTKNKVIRGNLPTDINLIPDPDRSILYKYRRFGRSNMKRFMASRDCPNSCKYCFNHLYHKIYKDQKKYFFQITNVDKIIKEVMNVKEKYGLEFAYFNDDDLTKNREWLIDFCEEFKKIGINFGASIRPENVDEEALRIMADSGCNFINISVESANENTQKFLRRGKTSNHEIIQACKHANESGIKVRLNNMVGLPVEDPVEDALETLDFNKSLRSHIVYSWASIFQPFPKTDLWKYCVEKELIDENTDSTMYEEDTVLKIRDAEKINSLHKFWSLAVKYNFPTDLMRILMEQPLTEEVKKKFKSFTWKMIEKDCYEIKEL